jgi:hypothetical protein
MAFDPHANLAYATVTTAPSPADSGLTIEIVNADAAQFPDPATAGEYNCTDWAAQEIPIRSNSEIIRITAKAAASAPRAATHTLLTIERAQESSLARSIIVGDQLAITITKKVIDDIENAIPVKATSAENAAGTDDAKFLTALSNVPSFNDFISRQAIINGNFDVWQRGTSIALTAANSYTSDRWYAETATATTDKTISRQDGTGVNGSRYCIRYLAAQDVDALNTLSQALETQDSIKFRGKKLTLSFYARGGAEFVADNATLVSKIVTGKGTDQKVLAFTTSADAISQNNTLTTSWVKFTCTTTAAIASDITQIGVSFSFTHAGSGITTNYFEVTQVQLCAGDVDLPFMPKSYDEELRACQRFYETIDLTANKFLVAIVYANGNPANSLLIWKVTKRSVPTLSVSANGSGRYISSVGVNNGQTLVVTGFNITIDSASISTSATFNASFGWLDAFGTIGVDAEL